MDTTNIKDIVYQYNANEYFKTLEPKKQTNIEDSLNNINSIPLDVFVNQKDNAAYLVSQNVKNKVFQSHLITDSGLEWGHYDIQTKLNADLQSITRVSGNKNTDEISLITKSTSKNDERNFGVKVSNLEEFRQTQLEQREKKLDEKIAEINETNKEALYNTEERTEVLNLKENRLNKLEEKLKGREDFFAEIDAQLDEKETFLNIKEKSFSKKNEDLKAKYEELDKREENINSKSSENQKKEEELNKKETSLNEKQKELDKKEKEIKNLQKSQEMFFSSANKIIQKDDSIFQGIELAKIFSGLTKDEINNVWSFTQSKADEIRKTRNIQNSNDNQNINQNINQIKKSHKRGR